MSLAAGMALAGGVTAATGAIHEANSQAALEEYQASQADYAASASQAGAAEDERRARVVAAKQIGQARANYGASGVSLDGSPLDVLEESARNAELDALSIRHKGDLEAWQYRSSAAMHRFSAGEVRTSGYITAASKLLQAGGSAASYSSGGSPSSSQQGAAGSAATKPTRSG